MVPCQVLGRFVGDDGVKGAVERMQHTVSYLSLLGTPQALSDPVVWYAALQKPGKRTDLLKSAVAELAYRRPQQEYRRHTCWARV
jgi:hypothetical protein